MYLATLHFGLELEFGLAYLPDPKAPTPPSLSSKCLRPYASQTIYPTQNPRITSLSSSLPPEEAAETQTTHWNTAYQAEIIQHITNTFALARLPVPEHAREYDDQAQDIGVWDVKWDMSVDGFRDGEEEGLIWYWAEIASPALPFTPESLEQVRKAVEVIKRNYHVAVNASCAMHVHVSAGLSSSSDSEFSFSALKKLIMFLWAFEPQLDTLHPSEFQQSVYAKSWRACSFMSRLFYGIYGILPSTIQGLDMIEGLKDTKELLGCMFGDEWEERYRSYNVAPLWRVLNRRDVGGKPTVEWRQHGGSVDEEEITNWITLHPVVGKFDRLDYEIPQHIDVLTYGDAARDPLVWNWEYETEDTISAAERGEQRELRVTWEVLQAAVAAVRVVDGRFKHKDLGFDPKSELWPGHCFGNEVERYGSLGEVRISNGD